MNYSVTYENAFFLLTVLSDDKDFFDILDIYLDDVPVRENEPEKIHFTYYVHVFDDSVPESKKHNVTRFLDVGDRSFCLQAGGNFLDVEIDACQPSAQIHIYKQGKGLDDRIVNKGFLLALRHFLIGQGFIFLHAAWLRRKEDNFLIAGSCGAGKSSLAISLAQTGEFTFLCDDQLFVKQNTQGFMLRGLPYRISMRENAQRRWPALAEKDYKQQSKNRRIKNPWGDVCTAITEGERIIILFPSYDSEGDGVALKKSEDKQAVELIFDSTRNRYMASASSRVMQEALFTFYTLIKSSDTYMLQYNDENLETIAPVLLEKWG